MTDLDAVPGLFPDADGPRPGAAPKRKCAKHEWDFFDTLAGVRCSRCGRPKDAARSRRGRTARKRGISDELVVARLLGGQKMGERGLPWDVELPGYLRAQAKKLDRWPSVNEVLAWLDAIPAGPELRAVTLADAPGTGGGRTRRLIVLDLAEFARRHGKGERE